MKKEVGFSEEFWRIIKTETGYEPAEVLSDERSMYVCMTREVIGNLLMEEFGFKEVEVGKLLGRDRTTAIYWRKMHQGWMESWPEYRELYDSLAELLSSMCDLSDIIL